MDASSSVSAELELPGFRFHPTEQELVGFYLNNTALGKKLRFDIITFVNIYRHDPWDLPELAKIGEREWYFFVSRDRGRHGHGGRPSRSTENGFWKATGLDRPIRCMKDPRQILGLRKTLVFYRGRAPRGSKTDWVMNEYRLPDSSTTPHKEDVVLCKIYRKAASLKVLERMAALEDENPRPVTVKNPPTDISFGSDQINGLPLLCLPDNASVVGRGGGGMQQTWPASAICRVLMENELTGAPTSQQTQSGISWTNFNMDPLFRGPWVENWASNVNF